jgi:hypothetical protein
LSNTILSLFPTADRLLEAPDVEIERALLGRIVEICDDQTRRMTTREVVVNELFDRGGYTYDVGKRNAVEKVINRAWKTLEDGGLIEEPDSVNGKNGYRIPSQKGRAVNTEADFAAAKVRARFTRDMFHPSLPDAAWNVFRTGGYDAAVSEAFKALEVAVRRKG